jgi:hypothetical protein
VPFAVLAPATSTHLSSMPVIAPRGTAGSSAPAGTVTLPVRRMSREELPTV